MNLRIPFVLLFSLLVYHSYTQRACVVATEIENASVVSETGTAAPLPEVIIIPVVVHVVYNAAEQNIGNDQVRSQLAVLNKDFRKKNAETAFIPAAFRDLASDTRIEFRLATVDPAGLATNGITRYNTSVTAFGANDDIKRSVAGGIDGWSRDHYLNIWVGNLSGGVMGYASLPGCSAEKDGVVISYKAFGTVGNLKAPYTKGRTAVHEIGHWLGLRHIWGDEDCGDDRIGDTPPQQGPTRGCPSGVIATCTSGAAGNMYMNFMDFTNDECTSMFTHGQANRMRELFNGGGARVALLSSNKAAGAERDDYAFVEEPESKFGVYPNPVVNNLNITIDHVDNKSSMLLIYNQSGQLLKTIQATSSKVQVDVSSWTAGLYYIKTKAGQGMKFVKGGR